MKSEGSTGYQEDVFKNYMCVMCMCVGMCVWVCVGAIVA